MKTFTTVIFALLIAATPAAAGGLQLGGDTYNTDDHSVNNSAQGGRGGNGGAGGTGIGTGVGKASSHSSANSASGVFGSGNSSSRSGVTGSGNSKVSTKTATSQGQGQDQSQGQVNGQYTKTDTSDSVHIGGDDVDNTTVVVNAPALANLPAAVCQGSSTTATIGGGGGLFGGMIGGGRSEESDDCNIRENIKLLMSLTAMGLFRAETAGVQEAVKAAVGQMTGFEGFLADEATAEAEAVAAAPVEGDRRDR